MLLRGVRCVVYLLLTLGYASIDRYQMNYRIMSSEVLLKFVQSLHTTTDRTVPCLVQSMLFQQRTGWTLKTHALEYIIEPIRPKGPTLSKTPRVPSTTRNPRNTLPLRLTEYQESYPTPAP